MAPWMKWLLIAIAAFAVVMGVLFFAGRAQAQALPAEAPVTTPTGGD